LSALHFHADRPADRPRTSGEAPGGREAGGTAAENKTGDATRRAGGSGMSLGPGAGAPTPPRLDALTGIRGIAAWLVVFYHVRFSFLTLFPPEAISALGKGYLAVDLFFVLSGFVLWFNYGEKLRS